MNPVAKFLIFHLKMSYQHADASSQTDEFEYLFSTAPKERPFDEFDLCNNDKKVNFHTGLHSFEMLNIVFRQVEHFVARKS